MVFQFFLFSSSFMCDVFTFRCYCVVLWCAVVFFFFLISMSIGNSKHFDGQHHRDAYTLAQTMCVLWLNAAGDFKSALLSCTEMHFLCNKRRCNQNRFGNPFQHSFYRSSFCSFGFSQLQFEMKWNEILLSLSFSIGFKADSSTFLSCEFLNGH